MNLINETVQSVIKWGVTIYSKLLCASLHNIYINVVRSNYKIYLYCFTLLTFLIILLEDAIAEINEKTDITISGDYDVYRHLTNGNEENMTPEEINKCRIKSMEMCTDDENRKAVTGLTFRMTMKPKEVAEDYLYDLFDDELVAERMRLKAMKKG